MVLVRRYCREWAEGFALLFRRGEGALEVVEALWGGLGGKPPPGLAPAVRECLEGEVGPFGLLRSAVRSPGHGPRLTLYRQRGEGGDVAVGLLWRERGEPPPTWTGASLPPLPPLPLRWRGTGGGREEKRG